MFRRYPVFFRHPANRHTYKVYPRVYWNTLNYGLTLENYQTGLFPVAESLLLRAKGEPTRDELPGLEGGMRTPRVVTLQPGQPLFRFARRNQGEADFTAPWWISKSGFEAVLARLRRPATPQGPGDSSMSLRAYARRHAAVFVEWHAMDVIGMAFVQKPIRCFMGLGNEILPADAAGPGPDSNVQLYVPNLQGQLGPGGHLSQPSVWAPEDIDRALRSGAQHGAAAEAKRLSHLIHTMG